MATPYITRSDLAALYGEGQVAAAESQAGVSVDAVIEAVCAMADGYVRCASPLPPVPEAVAMLRAPVAALAFARLYAHASTEAIRGAEKDAVAFLAAIAAGKVSLPQPLTLDDPATPEDESVVGASCGSAPRRMSRTQLRGW